MCAQLSAAPPPADPTELVAAGARIAASMVYVPERQAYAPREALSAAERLGACKQEFQLLKNTASKEAKRADKAEKKAAVLCGGYAKLAEGLRQQIADGAAKLRDAEVERECFQRLLEAEERELGARLAEARARVDAQRAREAELQAEYASAMMAKEAALNTVNRTRAAAAGGGTGHGANGI